MPLVRIDLSEGQSAEYRKAIADGVHRAIVEAIGIPADDHFQVVTEHASGGLICDPQYLGVKRCSSCFCAEHNEFWSKAPTEEAIL